MSLFKKIDKPLQLYKRLVFAIFSGHTCCPMCSVCLLLTGEAPRNPSESLIKRIAGGRTSVCVQWLEERICDALYRDELRRSAGVLDIGLWGPSIFSGEARRVLANIRPEFGVFVQKQVDDFHDIPVVGSEPMVKTLF